MKHLMPIFTLITCVSAPSLFASESTDTQALDKSYIAGFLAGAQLTDNEIIRHFDAANISDPPSDFLIRAFKTRVGERPATVPATYYAGFCLPENMVHDDVVEDILKKMGQSTNNTRVNKANMVFQTLRAQYPCQQP
ncbi:MAG: Rap1a/Tai family immunity protein [Pontibacterium sp.]